MNRIPTNAGRSPSGGKRGAGPDASVPDTFGTKNRKTSADATEKRTDPAKQAAGGKGKNNAMFPKQNADVAQPGQTGHRSDQNGPGKQFATSGSNKGMQGFNPVAPMPAGRTAPTRRADAAGRVDVQAGGAVKMPSWYRSRDRGASRRGG